MHPTPAPATAKTAWLRLRIPAVDQGWGGGGGSLFRKFERGGGGEGPPPASQQALDMWEFFSDKH